MNQSKLFNILDSVDSTNNYAMAKVHAGLATHGMAWFAREQTAGKGQRGKQWQSQPGNNILLSILLQPAPVFYANPFYYSAIAAIGCVEFLQNISGQKFYIKWPNDLFWSDRKTGGLLIENNYSGKNWKWAVLGIGINVNQTDFAEGLQQAISLKQIMEKNDLDPLLLAINLHKYILEKYNASANIDVDILLQQYNELLYKKSEIVRLKKGSAVFSTTIKEVNKFGQLITEDNLQRTFNFGEVQWVPQPG